MASDKRVKYRSIDADTGMKDNRVEKFENVESVNIVGDSEGDNMVLIVQHTTERVNSVRENVTDLFGVEEASGSTGF